MLPICTSIMLVITAITDGPTERLHLSEMKQNIRKQAIRLQVYIYCDTNQFLILFIIPICLFLTLDFGQWYYEHVIRQRPDFCTFAILGNHLKFTSVSSLG